MNAKFEYLYRDAGNNKKWGEVIFSNKENIDLICLDQLFRSFLIDHEFFIANKADLPEKSFYPFNNELDHDWYEYSSIIGTNEDVDDKLNRDIKEFTKVLKKASKI